MEAQRILSECVGSSVSKNSCNRSSSAIDSVNVLLRSVMLPDLAMIYSSEHVAESLAVVRRGVKSLIQFESTIVSLPRLKLLFGI